MVNIYKCVIMNFICIIYFKESNNLMEDQKCRMVLPQSETLSPDNIPSFLLKTYEILETDKYSDIISWTRSGQGFIVKKVKEFAENVLPIYFRHSNYTSFVRQLNMYDFHKTRQENHQNAFKNIMFKRGFKHLLKDIQRKDYKKNKDNNKEGQATDKLVMQRSKDYSKNQKNYELTSDISKNNLNKLIQMNSSLQKKGIVLAEIRDISSKHSDMLKLIDILFEAKKIHKNVIQKLELVNTYFNESVERQLSSFNLIDPLNEKQCPSTQAKITMFELGKQQRVSLSTNCFLFSSFNQV